MPRADCTAPNFGTGQHLGFKAELCEAALSKGQRRLPLARGRRLQLQLWICLPPVGVIEWKQVGRLQDLNHVFHKHQASISSAEVESIVLD